MGNTGESVTTELHWTFDFAQKFTTGDASDGYKLTRVDLWVKQPASGTPPTYTVSIHSDSSGDPGTVRGTSLTNPASFPTTAGLATWTAPSGGIDLDRNTSYWVVIDTSATASGYRIYDTSSDDEDTGAASGWSIANDSYFRSWNFTAWGDDSNSLRLAIHGYAKGAATQPQDQGGAALLRTPQPLQLSLWTDRLGYRTGETVRLYRTLDPHDDRGRYRTFVYLERAGGGERRYLAPLTAAGELHPEPVDHRGMSAGLATASTLTAADRALSWEGEAPAPGLWQFVLELRPGEEQREESEEPSGTRRAWAKFTVAERSVLLNRSGFDREIRSDMTLRSDTLYYLGHQLFVHDGATLTIEPGTLLQAWGSHAAIIVEPGGRIVAEGTREAPVVLTCSSFVGTRQPGCWAGLRILGRAPLTRPEGVAPGVLPPERPVYGGTDAEGSGGVLRYVRVEFAGASGDPEAPGPAIGLYGVGSGTVLDHVQARASLGDGFAFHGGTAVCDHCVASGSGQTGLSWERGWRGGALAPVRPPRRPGRRRPHRHQRRRRPRPRAALGLPALSNVTLLRAVPWGRRQRGSVALRLSLGSGVQGARPAGDPLRRRHAARHGPLAPAVRGRREFGHLRAAVLKRVPPTVGRAAGRGGVHLPQPEAARCARQP